MKAIFKDIYMNLIMISLLAIGAWGKGVCKEGGGGGGRRLPMVDS